MNTTDEVLVLSGVRTAIGKYGGGLASVPPCDLAATVVREAVSRAGVEPADVGHAVFGNVIHTEVRDMYLGRVASVNGGLPVETPAFTLNRLCGSGLQAIVSAAQAIKLGDCDAAVAGGAESMSRGQVARRHRRQAPAVLADRGPRRGQDEYLTLVVVHGSSAHMSRPPLTAQICPVM